MRLLTKKIHKFMRILAKISFQNEMFMINFSWDGKYKIIRMLLDPLHKNSVVLLSTDGDLKLVL